MASKSCICIQLRPQILLNCVASSERDTRLNALGRPSIRAAPRCFSTLHHAATIQARMTTNASTYLTTSAAKADML